MSEILGIDFGGVICSKAMVDEVYPPIPDVFGTLKRLRDERFGERIVIISHASHQLQRSIYDWLAKHDFYQLTGISFDKIHFCLERYQKVDVCNTFKVTHFIDDCLENLSYLRDAGLRNLYLFQGCPDEIAPYALILPSVIQVSSWQEVIKNFLI